MTKESLPSASLWLPDDTSDAMGESDAATDIDLSKHADWTGQRYLRCVPALHEPMAIRVRDWAVGRRNAGGHHQSDSPSVEDDRTPTLHYKFASIVRGL